MGDTGELEKWLRNKEVAEIGYTQHGAGMYADKFLHKNIQCENGRYVTIGDPYKGDKDVRPPRWRAKQLTVVHRPENSGGGYFGLMGRAFDYMPDKYVEQLPYAKTQPFGDRKNGFGSHDASKRDEFTQRIRTEQYRDLLKREKRMLGRGKHLGAKIAARIEAMNEGAKEQEKMERVKVGLDAPKHLYDIGRSRNTNFDPHMHADRFYNTHEARKREKRRGQQRTASMDIGDGVWAVKPVPTTHARSHSTRAFYNRGHIEVHDI